MNINLVAMMTFIAGYVLLASGAAFACQFENGTYNVYKNGQKVGTAELHLNAATQFQVIYKVDDLETIYQSSQCGGGTADLVWTDGAPWEPKELHYALEGVSIRATSFDADKAEWNDVILRPYNSDVSPRKLTVEEMLN